MNKILCAFAASLLLAGPAGAYESPEQQLTDYEEFTISAADFDGAVGAAAQEGIQAWGSQKLDLYFGNSNPLVRFCSTAWCTVWTPTGPTLWSYLNGVYATHGRSLSILNNTPTTNGLRRG